MNYERLVADLPMTARVRESVLRVMLVLIAQQLTPAQVRGRTTLV
jgi:hypothetical protein